MRLICPKCDAQYEIDDNVIPPSGRDVQCSTCDTTWFQKGAEQQSEAEIAKAVAVAMGKEQAGEPKKRSAKAVTKPLPKESEVMAAALEAAAKVASAADAPKEDAPAAATDEKPAPKAAEKEKALAEAAPSAAADTKSDAQPAAKAYVSVVEQALAAGALDQDFADQTETDPQRRVLDDSVVSILREEADREARARKSDATALGYEAELGMAVMASIARDTYDGPDEYDATDSADKGKRRGVLPDVDQINSTLSATTDRISVAATPVVDVEGPRRRLGFQRGFSTALAMAAVCLGIYLAAPRLAGRFPAAEPALSVYVTQVNNSRIWLDGQMQQLTLWMQGESEG